MNSTTKRIAAELQYASRTIFSSALRKLPPVERYRVKNMVDQMYKRLVQVDSKINKTDVLRLFATIGTFSALSDPNFAGSS